MGSCTDGFVHILGCFLKYTRIHIYAPFKTAVSFWSVSQEFVKSQHQNHYCCFLWTSLQFLLTKHCVTKTFLTWSLLTDDTGFCCGLHCTGDSRTIEEMKGSSRCWRNLMTDEPKHIEYSLGRQNILHARSLRLEIPRYLLLCLPHNSPTRIGFWNIQLSQFEEKWEGEGKGLRAYLTTTSRGNH